MFLYTLTLSLFAALFLSCVTASQIEGQRSGVRGSSSPTRGAVPVFYKNENPLSRMLVGASRSPLPAPRDVTRASGWHLQPEKKTTAWGTPTSRALDGTSSTVNLVGAHIGGQCAEQYCTSKWENSVAKDAAQRQLDPVDEFPLENVADSNEEPYEYVFVGTSPDATEEEVRGLPPVEEASGLLSDSQFTPGVLLDEGSVASATPQQLETAPTETLAVQEGLDTTHQIEPVEDTALFEAPMASRPEVSPREVDTTSAESPEPVEVPGSGYLPSRAFVEDDVTAIQDPVVLLTPSEPEISSTGFPLNDYDAADVAGSHSLVQQHSDEMEAPPMGPILLPTVNPYVTAEPLAPGEHDPLSTSTNIPVSIKDVATMSSAQKEEDWNAYQPSVFTGDHLPESGASPVTIFIHGYFCVFAAQLLWRTQ